MALNEIVKNALLSLTDSVYLYTAKGNAKTPYVVYGVSGSNDLFAGNRRAEMADSGFIDLFTKTETDPLIGDIPSALDAAGVSFYLNSVQFEEETGYLHFEWLWEALK